MKDFPDNVAMVLCIFIAGVVLVFLGFFLHSCTIEKNKLDAEYKKQELKEYSETKKEVIEKLGIPYELIDQLKVKPEGL